MNQIKQTFVSAKTRLKGHEPRIKKGLTCIGFFVIGAAVGGGGMYLISNALNKQSVNLLSGDANPMKDFFESLADKDTIVCTTNIPTEEFASSFSEHVLPRIADNTKIDTLIAFKKTIGGIE